MMNFNDAVADIPVLRDNMKAGLQGLKGEHSLLIICEPTRRLQHSIDLENALQTEIRTDRLWDYGIGWESKSKEDSVCFVEVHPANNSHVDAIIMKKQSLETWINQNALLVGRLIKDTANHLSGSGDDSLVFHWLSTSASIALSTNDPKRRKLNANGISGPKRRLALP